MRSLVVSGVALLRGNAVVLRNAAFLAVSSAMTAVFGFTYWWIAARSFPPDVVGIQSALISAMTFVGLLGEAGFGTMLLGEALGQGEHASALITAAVLAGTGSALVLAVPTAVVLWAYGWLTIPSAALFALGCALAGCVLVLDPAFLGLLRSRLQLYRNMLFGVFKPLFLLGVAVVTQAQTAILLSWVVALAVSTVLICYHAWVRRVLRLGRPNFRFLATRISIVIDHHLLNLAATAPLLLLPIVVSVTLGPAINAAFYAGWMIYSIGLLVPASLTTVLFTVGVMDPALLPRRLHFSLILSVTFGVVSSFVLGLFPDRILGLFNPAYPALAASAVPLLGFGLLGAAVKQHYILLARTGRRMMVGAFWLGLGACLELGLAAAAGVATGSVYWLTMGWLVAIAIQVGFLLRPVLDVTRGALPAAAT